MGAHSVLDRIEMHVIQVSGKVLAVAHDMVVVALLPQSGRCEAGPMHAGLGGALETSNQIRNANPGMWAQQKVEMVGQEHVCVVGKRMQCPRRAQCLKDLPAGGGIGHPRASVLGDQGKENGLPITVVASVAWHGGRMDACRERQHRNSTRCHIRIFRKSPGNGGGA